MSVKITGCEDMRAALQSLGRKLFNKIGRSAAREAMWPMRDQVEANAPVATGALKKQVKLRAMPRSRTYAFGVQVIVTDPEKKPVEVVAEEFGWDTKSGSHAEGKGYMRKGFDSTADTALETFLLNTREEIFAGGRC